MYIMPTIRKVHGFMCLMIVTHSIAVAEEKATDKTVPVSPVVLQIAVVNSVRKTTLAFTVTNKGKTEFRTSTFGGTWNRLVITDPNDKIVEVYDRVVEVEPTIIKPSESKTWKVEIFPVLETIKLEKPGIYKLSWKLRDITTDDTTFKYKSNEVLLLKEDATEKK